MLSKCESLTVHEGLDIRHVDIIGYEGLNARFETGSSNRSRGSDV